MKRFITLAAALLMLLFCLAGCAKFTCNICNEEKSGTQHKEELLGEEIVICDDCYEEFEELGDSLEDIGDSINDGLDDLGDALDDLGNLF